MMEYRNRLAVRIGIHSPIRVGPKASRIMLSYITTRSTLLVVLLSSFACTAIADEDTVQQSYDAAFIEMYKDVGNLDKTFDFAELAVQVGDLEGAIAALERMLIIDPNLPTVRMQLGVLYMQLESYAMAYAYLAEVRDHDQVPADVKQEAENLIGQIDAVTSAHKLTATVLAGIRYQTNANSGPLTNRILLFGEESILADQYTEQSDSDFSVTGQFQYVYDFEAEPVVTFDAGLSVYANRQDDQNQLDTRLIELTAGPRFEFSPSVRNFQEIKPYLLVSDLVMDDNDMFRDLGGGFSVSSRQAWNLDARYVERDYDDSSQAGLEGPRTRLTFGNTFAVSDQISGSLAVTAFDENTEDNWAAYREYSISTTLQRIFESPIPDAIQPWTGSLTLGFSDKGYQAANPSIDPDKVRKDNTLRASISLTIPFWLNTALITTVGYTEVDSNLPNYANENWFTSVSTMIQF